MVGMMERKEGTASGPVGEKQFCMSTMSRAERGGAGRDETDGEEEEADETRRVRGTRQRRDDRKRQ